MEVELFDGRVKAIIDPRGAWVTNLSDEYGDVLFPKRTLESDDGSKKIRGGCHVCLPNFGPGGGTNLSQHGFGRMALWEITKTTATSVTLRLTRGRDEYESLYSELVYTIDGNTLLMTLSVANNGITPLRVAPGFHPYFMAARNEDPIEIDGVAVSLFEINEAQFVTDNKNHAVDANKTHYSLIADNLPTWATWTDGLGSYVCVEPTVGGFTFLNARPTVEEQLMPDETKEYALRVAWERSR